MSIQPYFRVAQGTYDVLQELQVILGVEDHGMPARALEATLIWYDDMTNAGDTLRFEPPPGRPGWTGYIRPLVIDSFSSGMVGWTEKLMVEGPALKRLESSDDLLRLASVRGLERMVQLRAEEAFRKADNWTIEIDNSEEAAP